MTTGKQKAPYRNSPPATRPSRSWMWLYILCLVCATSLGVRAQTFTTLHNFDGTDGAAPVAPLIQGADGNFYGTTTEDGANGNFGTVFKITPDGVLTTVYDFCSQSACVDGSQPEASLVLATDGNFYGTTFYGGANNFCNAGCGTIFKITPSGMLTTLYNFCSQGGADCTDGSHPTAALVQATDGNFYGVTGGGGANRQGTAFKITPGGTLTTLYSFCSQGGGECSDGTYPAAPLVQATDGNFYGTTFSGGVSNFPCPTGCGTIFKMTPSGMLTTLYRFCLDQSCPSGDTPFGGLIQGSDGDFYGTAAFAGANGSGTIYKITSNGILTVLHNFDGLDGKFPLAGLIQATDGNFYGTTQLGRNSEGGRIFKITPDGTFTTLHIFEGSEGVYPEAALLQADDGNFYGTTYIGGTHSRGTVFRLDAGLGGPVVSLSATALDFGPQGGLSATVPQVVTMTNSGYAPLLITSILVTGQNPGDFIESDNCPRSPTSLGAGDSCELTVYFSPQGSGARTAAVTITDDAPGSPQGISLTGIGVSGKIGIASLEDNALATFRRKSRF
jgi:uncharacterized repeat protein (TIGR03803 family)